MFKRNKWWICVQREGSKGVWKEQMEKTMNKDNAWVQKTEIGTVEGPAKGVFLRVVVSNFFCFMTPLENFLTYRDPYTK